MMNILTYTTYENSNGDVVAKKCISKIVYGVSETNSDDNSFNNQEQENNEDLQSLQNSVVYKISGGLYKIVS